MVKIAYMLCGPMSTSSFWIHLGCSLNPGPKIQWSMMMCIAFCELLTAALHEPLERRHRVRYGLQKEIWDSEEQDWADAWSLGIYGNLGIHHTQPQKGRKRSWKRADPRLPTSLTPNPPQGWSLRGRIKGDLSQFRDPSIDWWILACKTDLHLP